MILGILATGLAGPAYAQTFPSTIPLLREWTDGPSSYQYLPSSRVVLDPAFSANWADTGTTVADDLQALTRVRPAVVSATGSAAVAGDIYLTLGSSDADLGEEGYRLEVGPVIRISARTVTGAFYGTRSVLQLLRRTNTVPGGVARDWPSFPERALMIDTVPRMYTRTWWENLMRDMAYTKMNDLTFMVYGTGVSDSQIAEIIAFAKRYHINVTPQDDIVSHAERFIGQHPGRLFAVGSELPANGAVDFTRTGALDIVRGEIERYIDLFPGKYFHAGADEYLGYWDPPGWETYPRLGLFARTVTDNPNATGADAFLWYLNWINGIVKSHGRTLRVWNDQIEAGGVVRLDTDIVVDYWRRPGGNPRAATAQQLADAGNRVLNANYDYLHYDKGGFQPSPKAVYENFRMAGFNGGDVTGAASIIGARLPVWMAENDGPQQSNDEVAGRLFEINRVLAQVTWGALKLDPVYGEEGQGFNSRAFSLGRAPGYRGTPPLNGTGMGPGTAYEVNGKVGYVLARPNGTVQHGYQPLAGSGPWRCETMPTGPVNNVAADPAMTRYADGAFVFLARRSDGSLTQARQSVAGAGPWVYRDLGRSAVGRPAVLVDARGQLVMAARQADGTVLFGREDYPGGPWTFTPLGSSVASDTALAADHNGKVTINATGTDGRLVHIWQNTPGVDTWTVERFGLAGMAGTPAVGNDSHGYLSFFVRMSDGRLQYGHQTVPGDGPWAFEYVGPGTVAGDPATVLDVNGRLTYFVRQANGHLQHGWETTPGVQKFTVEDIASGLTGDVSATNDVSGRIVYFSRDTSGNLRHGYQKVPGSGPWMSVNLPLAC
ncbi:glycoside hydrolase family 20 zincin-like fold domain-containing protein [Actinocrispum wychmicini]|uniref:glycoside hydrolase family 20 zincin-like fold domain-containing protein n=1 Tax=Actinocrispum wychmicini TaxID=1213861 RepID=UPI00140537E0|nr:glycoside hydrolase family 20 zincin-like fold domain-containing protein [Actinocrispum wychmicini]